LTGGVEAALTMKEAFREKVTGDWCDLGPRLCLAASAERTRDEDDSRACAGMVVGYYYSFVAIAICAAKESNGSEGLCV